MDRWKRSVLAEFIVFFILLSFNNSIILAFISILAHEGMHILVAKEKAVSLMIFRFIYMEQVLSLLI